jgi:hypothetical protein
VDETKRKRPASHQANTAFKEPVAVKTIAPDIEGLSVGAPV